MRVLVAAQVVGHSSSGDAGYRRTRLFFAAALALTMAGINASLRANTAADLQRIFLDPIDKVRSAELIGSLLGLPFLGFAVTIAIASPLLDFIGMGLLLPMAGVMFSVGMLIMIFATSLASDAIFDRKKVEVAGSDAAFKALPPGPELDRVLGIAAQTSFRYVAILPAFLLIVFAGIWLHDRSKGGYRAQRL